MRIIKYIFLLIILAMVALTVFVATQKGEFNITKTRVINSPKNVIYGFVNDYRNWENWNSMKTEDPAIKFRYPSATSGKGASFSWEGSDSKGSMKTLFTKDNDSIAQTMTYNGSASVVTWKFKDTVGGTKVTLHAKGKLDFMSKIYATAKGGAESVFSGMFEQNLTNLDRTLDYEINTYSVKLGGIVQKSEVMYLKQSINSTIDNAPKNRQIMLSKMLHFFKKNKIPMNGKPFVIYDTYNTQTGQTKFSVCIPIREEIHTSAGSDVIFGRLPSFRAAKVTLTGDYSHQNEAWQKGAELLRENSLERAGEFRVLELLTKNTADVKSPSQWVTDIYIPIRTSEPAPTPAPVRVSQPRRPAVSAEPIAEPRDPYPGSTVSPD